VNPEGKLLGKEREGQMKMVDERENSYRSHISVGEERKKYYSPTIFTGLG
jgi:hypothetical protein